MEDVAKNGARERETERKRENEEKRDRSIEGCHLEAQSAPSCHGGHKTIRPLPLFLDSICAQY